MNSIPRNNITVCRSEAELNASVPRRFYLLSAAPKVRIVYYITHRDAVQQANKKMLKRSEEASCRKVEMISERSEQVKRVW